MYPWRPPLLADISGAVSTPDLTPSVFPLPGPLETGTDVEALPARPPSAILSHMVNSRLDVVFGALADPTRRAMVAMLAETGPRTAGELAAPHPISLPAVSKHLTVLERAGLTTRERRGRHQVFSLNAPLLNDAATWLERNQRFWTERVDALEAYLAAHRTEENR
jgi:DNA-binding transcriptional ArsR family regulator